MKQYRIYRVYTDGRQRCVSRRYDEQKAVDMAAISVLMANDEVDRVEIRCPDGEVRAVGIPKSSPEGMEKAKAFLASLSPEELEERKRRRMRDLFAGFRSRP